MTAKALGFDRPAANSLDAVSDRDFVMETLAAASITAVHLSRFAEEIVMWSSPLVGFVQLSDKFTTGSSIMPQKRNPDAAELVRAKTGRIFGALQALLVVMKGLPLAYQKDMQEDKEGAMDALSALMLCIAAMAGMVADMKPDAARMKAAAGAGYSTATDLADWLVRTLQAAVPRGAPHHRPDRGRRRAGRRAARKAAARRHAGDRTAHHQGGVRCAVGRALGRKPHQLRRHRARQRAARGHEVVEKARQKVTLVGQAESTGAAASRLPHSICCMCVAGSRSASVAVPSAPALRPAARLARLCSRSALSLVGLRAARARSMRRRASSARPQGRRSSSMPEGRPLAPPGQKKRLPIDLLLD